MAVPKLTVVGIESSPVPSWLTRRKRYAIRAPDFDGLAIVRVQCGKYSPHTHKQADRMIESGVQDVNERIGWRGERGGWKGRWMEGWMQFASLAGGSSIKVPNIVCTHGGRSFPPLCASLVAGSTGSGIRSAMVTSYNGGGTDDHGDLSQTCLRSAK
ncbi:hypothetical protein J7T55_011091 [Diaporthe amygdali]|uniref:uncharacterized protein n=1 Tax=Phomopsis amygdali TaxID=1214568 RepID=UPI0022FE7F88|nr:uncharacterized protein J7T55_011091 [Diaporthe amygdali]KAJ0106996.1 hypothetical protein J7T55_011091 [Diaporthe amygdali]